jgi:hypothetical protein
MKKYGKYLFLGTLAVMLGVLSYNSCTHTDTVVSGKSCVDGGCPFEAATEPSSSLPMVADAADEVLAVRHDQLVSGDGWEFLLPPDWKLKVSSDKQVLAMAYLESSKELVMFLREAYSAAPEGYVIEALRGIKGAGAKILSSKQQELNGVKYTVIESDKDGVIVWAWVTVKNNFGYVFTCGGDELNQESHHISCDKIAMTLKVK